MFDVINAHARTVQCVFARLKTYKKVKYRSEYQKMSDTEDGSSSKKLLHVQLRLTQQSTVISAGLWQIQKRPSRNSVDHLKMHIISHICEQYNYILCDVLVMSCICTVMYYFCTVLLQ